MANLRNMMLGLMMMATLVACGGPQEHGVSSTASASTGGRGVATSAEPTPEPKELVCYMNGPDNGSGANLENVTCVDGP